MAVQANNRRIATNTLMLYVRMLVIMAIGLYTSRVVLQTLGVSDFGLYNVVGGVVTTVAFLNSALTAASQRFISFELGRGNDSELNRVFSTSVTVHAILAVICFILVESVGSWFLNYRMNIAPERLFAANCVFQCSILTFMINVISVPYSAAIVAHEKMSVFAYISILEAVMKLVIVFILLFVDYDKLIVYALLQLTVALIVRFCYSIYCKCNFEECKFRFLFDKEIFKRMFSFAGWSVVGNIGFTMKDPLSNIILNLFFGTTINAARGIAIQVNSLVNSFVANFGMAMNPQIVKRYAAGEHDRCMSLVYNGARLSFYLITVISIPVIINIDYILNLWLGVVPEYTSIFFILTLFASLIVSLGGTSSVAVQATGRIKWFSIGISIILMSELPIAYILLKFGYPPYAAMIPTLVMAFAAVLFRFYILKRNVGLYSWRVFLLHIVARCFLTFGLALSISWFIRSIILHHDSFLWLILNSLISLVVTICLIFILGIDKGERKKLLAYASSAVKSKLHINLV